MREYNGTDGKIDDMAPDHVLEMVEGVLKVFLSESLHQKAAVFCILLDGYEDVRVKQIGDTQFAALCWICLLDF